MRKSDVKRVQKELKQRRKELFEGIFSQIRANIDDPCRIESDLDAFENKQLTLAKANAAVTQILTERFKDNGMMGLRKALKKEFGE